MNIPIGTNHGPETVNNLDENQAVPSQDENIVIQAIQKNYLSSPQ